MGNWGVVAGHNAIIPGAAGNGFQEHVVARQLKDKVIHYLRLLGETAHDCTDEVGRNKTQVWMNAANNCDRTIGKNGKIIAIHLNSSATGQGTGTEVLDYKGTQKELCQRVSARLSRDFAWRDRGWKDGSGIGLINETQAPVIYVEACFINNASDITKLTRNMDMAAIGIVEEVTGKKVTQSQSTSTHTSAPSVVYEAHCQEIGWQGKRKNGERAGTVGEHRRIEALTVKLENSNARLEMEGHIEGLGWTSLRTNGEIIGTIGEGLRLEALKIKANGLNIQYRAHVENIGWTDWKENGEEAGTTGQGLRIEAIEIKLG